MSLEWNDKRTEDRGYRSKCGKYSVCSITIDGHERWEAWKMVPGGAWFRPIAINLASETAAREQCEMESAR